VLAGGTRRSAPWPRYSRGTRALARRRTGVIPCNDRGCWGQRPGSLGATTRVVEGNGGGRPMQRPWWLRATTGVVPCNDRGRPMQRPWWLGATTVVVPCNDRGGWVQRAWSSRATTVVVGCNDRGRPVQRAVGCGVEPGPSVGGAPPSVARPRRSRARPGALGGTGAPVGPAPPMATRTAAPVRDDGRGRSGAGPRARRPDAVCTLDVPRTMAERSRVQVPPPRARGAQHSGPGDGPLGPVPTLHWPRTRRST
jgi:hypothetical protein